MSEDVTEVTPESATTTIPTAPTVHSSKVDGKGRDRGALEVAIIGVTDAFVAGDLTLGEGEFLTPHRIARAVQEKEGRKVSAGAVAARLQVWLEIGFAQLNQKPFAFSDYTQDARDVGLSGLKDRAREARKAAKAEAKAEAPAEVEPPVETSPEAAAVEATVDPEPASDSPAPGTGV